MRAIIALLLLSVSPAAAQELNCTDPSSQVEMTGCADRELTEADARLNDAYARAVSVAKHKDAAGYKGSAVPILELLKNAQRAWIPYRDRACDLEASTMEGGSGQSMVYLQCKTRLTRTRTRDLRIFIEHPAFIEDSN